MLTSVEVCLRQGQLQLQRWVLNEKLRAGARVLAVGGGGFFLSAAGLAGAAQPVAMGLICSLTGWRSLVLMLGAMVGSRVFWGRAGIQGMFFALWGGILSLLSGKSQIREQPLLLPALAAAAVALSGPVCLLGLGLPVSFRGYLWQVASAGAGVWLFRRASNCRDAVTDWILGGVLCLVLARLPVLGCALGAILSSGSAFPGAVLAGLGLDLSGESPVPMGPVLCIGYFLRLLPVPRKWLRSLFPAVAALGVMLLCGVWDPEILPGLLLGGVVGFFLPPRPYVAYRKSRTGAAQVRLELAAGIFQRAQQLLLETPEPPVDEAALLRAVQMRSCGSCPSRQDCRWRDNLPSGLLRREEPVECREPKRLREQLNRGREQLRTIQADRARLREYRGALVQQYQFLGAFLRDLADRLPGYAERSHAGYRVEISARSSARGSANGDRCAAFPGRGCRYYVLLCDGMGTGLGAEREGGSASALLQQMLTAGLPPEYAFRFLNSLLTLRGQAGAVTLDLALIRLDSGRVTLYKWGAAPSWVLRSGAAEKIGFATPPPGISVLRGRETVLRVALRREETLLLLSDGVDAETVMRRRDIPPDLHPGQLAAWILEQGSSRGEDDATVVAVRLSRRSPVPAGAGGE